MKRESRRGVVRPGLVIAEPRSTAQAIANSQSHGDSASELLLATDASVRKWLDGGSDRPLAGFARDSKRSF